MNNKERNLIDKHIGELVYEKVQLRKAYQYYHCVRDAEQFRHIEENYGIGTPTVLGFSPLVKKHIDVLVGEYLELDPDLQISCKDDKTINNVMRDKKLAIDTALYNYLKQYLQNTIIGVLLENKQAVNDPYIEKQLQKVKEDVEKSFVSQYEVAAQNILNHIKNSRSIDLKNKMRELFTDLLISGICYYRTKPTGGKNNMKLEILNPLNTFIERNYNDYFLNKSRRAVVRRYLSPEQVLEEFGDELSKSDIAKITEDRGRTEFGSTTFVHVPTSTTDSSGNTKTNSTGILGGLEVTPMFPWDNQSGQYTHNYSLITVYEVEWIEFDKQLNQSVRHEGVRISDDIYIERGAIEDVSRSVSDPKACALSINGLFFLDKNGAPFSLVLSTAWLQDKYDILLFYRENLIATSGTKGSWMDFANLPAVLGADLVDRITKWEAYAKNGTKWIDSTQEGGQLMNTIFNGYDDTVSVNSIQAIQMAIDAIEMQICSITGVMPEKLGGIQERDAVSNVKVGIKYSTLLTKQYFSAMDMIYKEVNYDLLNLARIVFKKGVTGTLILGDKLAQTFIALPEHYTMTDFDIHIKDSTETLQQLRDLQMLNVELIKAGLVDTAEVFNITTAKNLTELRDYLNRSMATKKQENDQLTQMQQQMQQLDQTRMQLEQQLQEINSQNQQLQRQLQQNSVDQLELDKRRLALDEKEVRDKKDYNDKIIKNKDRALDVEVLQMQDTNPYNDKISK